MIKDLQKKARSYRRYDAAYVLEEEVLRDLVDTARYASSGSNLQPLKYKLVYAQPLLDQVFAVTKWAVALKGYNGPAPEERPTGYIAIVADKGVTSNTATVEKDVGIAAAAIALGAVEKELGSIMMSNFSHEKAREVLELDEMYEPMLLIAVGKPTEEIVMEEIDAGQPTAYYREGVVHHVPKRKLEDILL